MVVVRLRRVRLRHARLGGPRVQINCGLVAKGVRDPIGRELWVSEQTVANYEKGKTEAGPADRALRFLFLAHLVDDDDLAEELRLEAEDLMRRSRKERGAIGAGPWALAECT